VGGIIVDVMIVYYNRV